MTGTARKLRPSLVLTVTMLGTLMVFSSTTSINVALPAIADALHPGAGVADWFLLAYMLANSVLILVFARISDFLGRRTIYLAGVALMTAASIACALAPDTVIFIAMRALQGVGAAIVLTNVNALVADVYPEGRRSAALGLNVMGGSVAGALGPVLGGVLVGSLGWQSVFLVNVPFGIAGLVLGLIVLPRAGTASRGRERFDGAGAVLSVITLFALLFAINRISAWGIADLRVVLSFVVAVLAFAAFAVVEARQASPLIDLDVITRGRRYFAYAAVFFISVPQSTLPIAIVLYEQLVLGRSATSAGLVIIPFAVVVAITAPIAGRVVHRHPPHRLPIVGGLVMSVGLVILLGYFTLGAPSWMLFGALVVAGFGNGLFHTPNIAVIMSGIPSNRFGVAGGVRSVLFNSSQSIGTAVVLLILGAWFTRAGGSGLSQRIQNPALVEPAFVIVSLVMIG
ncbi:MAG: transporter, partial [Frondihabitans sp.]|nr:transporter [Frondihabitans sp.]